MLMYYIELVIKVNLNINCNNSLNFCSFAPKLIKFYERYF